MRARRIRCFRWRISYTVVFQIVRIEVRIISWERTGLDYILETDLLTVMQAVTDERLGEIEVQFSNKHACCVIMASKGYPESYAKGFEITIPEELADNVFVAGGAIKEGKLVTSGGRVLGATAIAETLPEAIKASYEMVEAISFDNSYFRRDIGARALKAWEVK